MPESSSLPPVGERRRGVGRWVESLRGPRPALDPRRPGGWQIESERGADGLPASVLTIFLTNRECPWRCVFCDLWQHALEGEVAPGDIPHQLDLALGQVAARDGDRPSQVKLYNAGSFFDPRAIPPDDHAAIADRLRGFERVIVECHPALVDDRVPRFAERLNRTRSGAAVGLEVAMGLETLNPDVLPHLNKGLTPALFARASRRLREAGVAIRTFVLVQPPFEAAGQAVTWAARSTAWAFEHGSTVVSLIPVRPGRGALEALRAEGRFEPPTLETFEAALDAALALAPPGGRVFADLWDLERLDGCRACFGRRRERLERLNRTQRPVERARCDRCRAG